MILRYTHRVVNMVFGNEFPMKVQVCKGKSCSERGAAYLETRLNADIRKFDYDVTVEACLCQGKCANSPVILINGETFERMNPVTASQNLVKKLNQLKSSFISKP